MHKFKAAWHTNVKIYCINFKVELIKFATDSLTLDYLFWFRGNCEAYVPICNRENIRREAYLRTHVESLRGIVVIKDININKTFKEEFWRQCVSDYHKALLQNTHTHNVPKEEVLPICNND